MAQDCPPPPDCPATPPPQQCPECAACPAAAQCPPPAAGSGATQPANVALLKREQQERSGSDASAAAPAPEHALAAPEGSQIASGPAAEPLCGGPDAIPSVMDSLDAASAAVVAGLDEAFAPWAETGFTLEDLMATADALGAWGMHDCAVWIEVYNGTVIFPRRFNSECKWFCNEWVKPLRNTWEQGIREGTLRVPEGVPFMWNVFDHPLCHSSETGKSNCRAPLLSIIKNPSMSDVLVPPFGRKFEPIFEPWSLKSNLAFFRGSPWCSVHPLGGTEYRPGSNCSRESLSILSDAHPGLLNVSINRPYGRAPGKEGPAATHMEHAHYKYLLQLDGITASRRFATLLSMNSLVLKQESLQLEWYYHALQPCVHYLPFWQGSEEDVLGLLSTLRSDPANDLMAQRIAANANAFAAAWLDDDGQLRYWQMVIDRYVQLYRGSTDAATLKVKRQTELWGQAASKLGSEREAECWEKQEGPCWLIGRDEAVAEFKRLREEASNQGTNKPGGGKKGRGAGKAGDAGGAQGGGSKGEDAPAVLPQPGPQQAGDGGQAADERAAAGTADPADQAAVQQAGDKATAAEQQARRALRAYMEADMGDEETHVLA
ncbi:hypothetical protein ABPG77_000078 [Micractinium sp. CCAP 211/92]